MYDPLMETLVKMSRYLGDPSRNYAILGEGNTSARIGEDTFWVKASGWTLETIDKHGFVKVSRPVMMDLIEDSSANDDTVKEALMDCLVEDGETKRPSVETMLHAVLLTYPEYEFVGHTHPVHTNMVLCSKAAEEAVAGRLFPDHVVGMGHKSVFVPYVDPGLPLAREVKARLEAFIEAEGMLPVAILMQNHGLITMGASAKAVTSATDMAEKASRILVGTYAMGGPNFMSEEHVERIFTRPDEHYRLKHISS